MLKHPWLDMADNFDFKYSDREYEIMILKKDHKKNIKGVSTQPTDDVLEEKQEMNELIDSDPELYSGDCERNEPPSKQKKKAAKQIVVEDDLFNLSEISLEDPEDARENYNRRKAEECKIHNSFTGPYPLDPSEFSHTDKGENTQFEHVLHKSWWW